MLQKYIVPIGAKGDKFEELTDRVDDEGFRKDNYDVDSGLASKKNLKIMEAREQLSW